MTDNTNTVLVYVRLCGDERQDCRELGFRIPEKLSQKELLDEGFAIDGNSATVSLMGGASEDGTYLPMSEVLRDYQRHLVQWLGTRGYSVQFK